MRPRTKVRISNKARLVAPFVTVALGLSACTSPSDVAKDQALPTPSSRVIASPTTPEKTAKSAGARCRKRVEVAKQEEFIPPTQSEGAKAVLPVVFADGSSAELVYSRKLKLAQLGVQPSATVGIAKGKSGFLHPRFLMITKTPLREFRRTGAPVETYEGVTGQVNVWRAKDPDEFLNPIFLHFGIGTWNVIVGDGNAGNFMGSRNRKVWAENLGGYETDAGFLVLEPRPPLAFSDDPGRPDIYLSTCFRFIELRLERCKELKADQVAKDQYAQTVRGVTVHRNERGRQAHANWCTPSGQISVYVSDNNKRFVDLAMRQLQVRDVTVQAGAD